MEGQTGRGAVQLRVHLGASVCVCVCMCRERKSICLSAVPSTPVPVSALGDYGPRVVNLCNQCLIGAEENTLISPG